MKDANRKAMHAKKEANRIGRLYVKHNLKPASKKDIVKGDFHLHNIHYHTSKSPNIDLVGKGRKK